MITTSAPQRGGRTAHHSQPILIAVLIAVLIAALVVAAMPGLDSSVW